MKLISKKTIINELSFEPSFIVEVSIPAMTILELGTLRNAHSAQEMYEIFGRAFFELISENFEL